MYMPNTSKLYKHCQINNIHRYSYAKALHYYLTISCETTNYDEDDKIRQCSVFVYLIVRLQHFSKIIHVFYLNIKLRRRRKACQNDRDELFTFT